MDSPRERWLAALLGGTGTLLAVIALEVVPQMVRRDLELRSQASAFALMVFVVGASAGWVGHLLFIHVIGGSLVARAWIVGAGTGLAIGLTTWCLTYLMRDVFFPFEPRPGYVEALKGVWKVAAIAGPTGGVAASMGVVRHLRRHPPGD